MPLLDFILNKTAAKKGDNADRRDHRLTNKEMMQTGAKVGLGGLGSAFALDSGGKFLHDKELQRIKDKLGEVVRPMTDKDDVPYDTKTLDKMNATQKEREYVKHKKALRTIQGDRAAGANTHYSAKAQKIVDDYEESLRQGAKLREKLDNAKTIGSKFRKAALPFALAGTAGTFIAAESGLGHLLGKKYYGD
jgi:hypothetical protein